MGAPAGPTAAAAPITPARILAIAAPVAVSNATTPLQGAVDAAVIGNLGEVAPLAAVGLGAEILSLTFAGVNFLQISTSGIGAQALGARDQRGVVAVLLRALIVAFSLAALFILMKSPIRIGGLAIFEASAEAEALAGRYVDIRMWGAPAELANMALIGWFAGQEMTRRLFMHQIFVSATNIALSLTFVAGFGWGVAGVAAATVAASFAGLAFGLWLAFGRARQLTSAAGAPSRAEVFQRAAFGRLFRLSGDFFIRTMLLVGVFAWMTRLGSLLGDAVVAVNVILFQFFIVSAYALDGFAIASESLVGQAVGARDRGRLIQSVRLSMICCGAMAAIVSLLFAALAGPIIDIFSTSPEVRALARDYALWAALIPLIGFASFIFDGVFVGATRSREMRDGMIISTALYAPLSWVMMDAFGNHGVWAAVWIWLILRAVTLAAFFPRILRQAAAS